MNLPDIHIAIPEWVADYVDPLVSFETRESRVAFAIELARQNVVRRSGGPFGAAIFEAETGRVVSVGVNLVVPCNNSLLHAEVVAIMLANTLLETYTLGGFDGAAYELATSCEPCAMCLGAILWSGIRAVASGASGDDAREIMFDEGPVFDRSYEYLEQRGIEFFRDIMKEEARSVLRLYRDMDGLIYNG